MSSITEDDALKLLDIKKGASIAEISAAYKKASKKVHPDKGGTDDAFIKVQQAKEKLMTVAIENGTPVADEIVSDKENIKNVIVVDDAFFLIDHEKEYRDWRKPNMKIMNRLAANNHNKETEMIIDFCMQHKGGSYLAIEDYLRHVVGITSPYHMNDRVLAMKRSIEMFKEHMSYRGVNS